MKHSKNMKETMKETILAILNENATGLTTAQIVKKAMKLHKERFVKESIANNANLLKRASKGKK